MSCVLILLCFAKVMDLECKLKQQEELQLTTYQKKVSKISFFKF